MNGYKLEASNRRMKVLMATRYGYNKLTVIIILYIIDHFVVIDSERSEKCIGFTMCIFFLYAKCIFMGSKYAPITTNRVYFWLKNNKINRNCYIDKLNFKYFKINKTI